MEIGKLIKVKAEVKRSEKHNIGTVPNSVPNLLKNLRSKVELIIMNPIRVEMQFLHFSFLKMGI